MHLAAQPSWRWTWVRAGGRCSGRSGGLSSCSSGRWQSTWLIGAWDERSLVAYASLIGISHLLSGGSSAGPRPSDAEGCHPSSIGPLRSW